MVPWPPGGGEWVSSASAWPDGVGDRRCLATQDSSVTCVSYTSLATSFECSITKFGSVRKYFPCRRICVLISTTRKSLATIGARGAWRTSLRHGPRPRAAASRRRLAYEHQQEVTMTRSFEYISYDDADQLTMTENTAANDSASGQPIAGGVGPESPGFGPHAPSGRTEALINGGRAPAGRSWTRWLRSHLRPVAIAVATAGVGIVALVIVLPGGGASWPGSVAQVKAEITTACQNPNVAAEPSQLNFACAKSTQQILWVFALLTSGNNPGFVDQTTGRKGLEPIQPAQGGDIAWSLNLHQPYNPANPVDSLQVAARAINNIISGATLTSSSGTPDVEAGLESTAANCQRYTGSALLVTRSGFPARCAQPVSTASGQAALVSDVFEQWMGGTPSQMAAQAGVLFENADNPGNQQVQAILTSLPSFGM